LFAAVRGSVGVRTPPRGSDRSRAGLRFSVSFQQKSPPVSVLRCPTAAENGGYDQEGCDRGEGVTSSPAYNVESVTNTSSASCANDGRRGVLDARRRPSRLYFSQFATLRFTVDNTVDSSEARFSSRIAFFCLPHLDENGLTYRHSFSSYGSPIILVLPASNIFTNLRRGHL